jgi:uncharacterized membrane protein
VPFPTSLMGEYLLTDHAAPAVVLYDSVLAVQALAWILLAWAALAGHLANDHKAASKMRENLRNAYFALALHALLAVVALWFPLAIAIVTSATWIYWLVWGIRVKQDR